MRPYGDLEPESIYEMMARLRRYTSLSSHELVMTEGAASGLDWILGDSAELDSDPIMPGRNFIRISIKVPEKERNFEGSD